MWTVLDGVGLRVEWWPAVSFVLVLVWWDTRLGNGTWSRVYRVCAVLMTLFLIANSYLLNASTTRTIVATWVAGAALVTYLGLRYGAAQLGPLAIVMLVCASLWGLPPVMWPLVGWRWQRDYLFVEHQASRPVDLNSSTVVEISAGLVVLLSGAAVLFSVAPTRSHFILHSILLFEAVSC
jgi:hypothetical protein